jgi:hypothetical protein
VVAPGANATIEIKMRDDGAELEGTLGNLSAEPSMTGGAASTGMYLPKAWVYCVPLPDSAGQFQQLGVSSDGTFTSQMMTPGEYRVLAFARQQPNLPYRDPEAMRAYESKGPVIHLAAGQKANVQLQLIANSE